ncbi:hypothetical protein G6L45_16100 [Agrobacterium rhizogenes]|nr:hypothetical protein [Rhizobium rhizogenes]NTH97007.1 hypothetical protein [Rhizobium rhizogenes]NTJ15193.1 hypothetical protein [Rhizobium rhizogenes]
MNAIALAVHPGGKDAGATVVREFWIGGSCALVFKLTNGFVPAYRDMAAPGFMPDEATAVEWVELYAGECA